MANAERKLPGAVPSEVYDAASYEPRRTIGYLMARVKDSMQGVLDRELAEDPQLAQWELTAPQLKIIFSIAADGEAKSASDVCKRISYDAGAMTRMIDRLESKGLIQRERCPNDRRLVFLALTEEGRTAYPRMKELHRGVLNRFLRSLSKAEASELESLLRRMLENG
jgi:DNA-binding MarR family transcriptional regulator